MPKHYRPPGKKKEGNAARYMTRSQALKYLHISLSLFRKLCILKGVFPREPKKRVKGNHRTYYHLKDILFLKHEPLLETFREMRAYERKVKKAMSRKNRDLAERLLNRKPSYTLDMIIYERYPRFIDALRDLDDSLSMVHLFAALPAVEREKIEVKQVHTCQRLSHEWQAYISHTHKLRKTFVSVKGIYYQAEVEGQKITWLTPHALQQVLPDDVDYKILLTFQEFYETLIGFVNLHLYKSIKAEYPPILERNLEAVGADHFALSRYLNAYTKDSAEKEDDDEDTKECKNLFKNFKFFLSREVPKESLLFIIPAFGGAVSWDVRGAPFRETRHSITHQIVDRPTQGRKYLTREYVQPQWVYDCVNARTILPTEKYMVGSNLPPHLSPFVDNEAEGYVPDYAKTIKDFQVAGRKEILPMPGVDKDDLDDLMLTEGIIDRAEAIEDAEKKRKMSLLEKQYHNELQMELQASKHSSSVINEKATDEEESGPDMQQIAEDEDKLSQVLMSRKKRKLKEAMDIGKKRKQGSIDGLKERKIKLDAAK